MKLLPKRPLNELDLYKYCKNIPYFRGVFMRDNLPKKPRKNECAIINLDDSGHGGTHWCAYRKCGVVAEYFDSFGNLQPPLELVKYLGADTKINYNYVRYQDFNTYNCGHLCIQFLLTPEKFV